MERCAFFDLDGTLIRDVSLLALYQLHLWGTSSGRAPSRREAQARLNDLLAPAGPAREARNRAYYRAVLAHMTVNYARSLCDAWVHASRNDANFWHPGALRALREHQRLGVVPVIVTASFREAARAVGRELGIRHCLCAPLEIVSRRYTGRLTAPPMVGDEKRIAIEAFAARRGVRLMDCFAYGDDETDVAMLRAVGQPRVVACATPSLLSRAAESGWPAV